MVGRSTKVYATDETASIEGLNHSFVEMEELPAPNDIGMSNLAPKQDDKTAQEDALNTTLHQCARDGDDESMLALLEHLGDRKKKMINKWDDYTNRMNPLHYAARYNHFKIVKILIEHGANVQHPGEDGQTALHFAAKYKKARTVKKSNTYDSNIGGGDEGADETADNSQPNIVDAADSAADEVQSTAESDDVPDDQGSEPGPGTPLLDDVPSETANGKTTITLSGDGEESEDKPADKSKQQNKSTNTTDGEKRRRSWPIADPEPSPTPPSAHIGVAPTAVPWRCNTLSLHTHGHHSRDPSPTRTRPHIAKKWGLVSSRVTLHNLFSRKMPESATTENIVDLSSYKLAADSVIAYLVRNGADPNARDAYGSTPLHFAAMRDNETALLDLLCMRGIQIEAADKQKMTALHLAATHDNKESCRLLLLKGAELRCQDDENSTPLHMAATEGNTDVVKMLFEQAELRDSWVSIQNMITDQDQEGNTGLHLAVENGHYEVVNLCLEKNANVNKPRQNFVTPLHLACTSGDLRIVQKLVENNARINALDGDQSTPLHKATAYNNYQVIEYLVKKGARLEKADKDNFTALLIAASNGHVEALKMIIKLGGNVMVTDKSERTALHWAAEENQPEIMKALLNHPGGDELLDANDRYGHAPLHVAASKGYMDCVRVLLDFNADIADKTDEEQTPLHLAAQNGMTHIVKLLTQTDKTIINDYDENSNAPLHLAALEGHTKVAAMLLDAGADIAARNCTLWTPIDCAAANGRVKMIRVLLDYDSPLDPTDRSKTTPLHLACKRGHPDCVKLLIEKGANINIKTADGFNCMDLAIDKGHKEVVQTILNSDKWMDAMKHAHIDLNANGMRVTPMRKLIRKMPDMAEKVFHLCTNANEHSPESQRFQITFNYELLDDQYTSWENDDGSSRQGEASSLQGGSVYGDDNKVLSELKPYSDNKSLLKKNHPLLIMVRSEREDLLAHPLVTSLLRHKWHTVGRYFYYTNLIIYLIFLITLTGFALTIPSPYSVVTRGFTNETHGALKGRELNASCEAQAAADGNRIWTGSQRVVRAIFIQFGLYVCFVTIGIKLLMEIFQLLNAKLAYFGYENILEWILYVTSLLFLIPFSDRCIDYRQVWQWEVGVIAVFLAWFELILMIRKLPRFGIYVVMFTHVVSTFAQFFVVFFLFLIGFAISFYMLLSNQTPFRTVENSLLKTAIMMIGEFEFDNAFNSEQENVFLYYPPASYIIFIIFFVLMTILIMNLLVGLAVDDIKGVQDQAVLTRMAMQVELALTVESMLPELLTRRFIMRVLKVKPNTYRNACDRHCCGGGAGAVLSGMSTSNLAAALNPELDDIEKVMEEQEQLRAYVGKINAKTKELRAQNNRLESMLQALLKHNNIDYTDMDQAEDDDNVDLSHMFK